MNDTSIYKVRADYIPGFGWQYVISNNGQILIRRGSFETEQEAINAGNKILGWW